MENAPLHRTFFWRFFPWNSKASDFQTRILGWRPTNAQHLGMKSTENHHKIQVRGGFFCKNHGRVDGSWNTWRCFFLSNQKRDSHTVSNEITVPAFTMGTQKSKSYTKNKKYENQKSKQYLGWRKNNHFFMGLFIANDPP